MNTSFKRTFQKTLMNTDVLPLLLEHAPASLAMFDRQMRYLAVSRRWREDHGLLDRELLGRSHYEVFPEIPESWKEAHRRGLQGEVVRSEEDRFARQDGSVQVLRWEVRPWRTGDGEVGGIVIFTEDITQRVQAAEAERRVREKLEAALESMQDALFISDAEGRFLEFNQAFATFHKFGSRTECATTFAEYPGILDVYLPDGQPAPVSMWAVPRALRGETAIAAEYGLRRKDTGERWFGSYSFAPIRDPKGAIIGSLAAVLLAELRLAEPDRRVEAEVEPGLEVDGDSRMVDVAMRNLVGNAWKYTGRCPQARIRVRGEVRQGRPWISVADNGAGFDMAHSGHLFQPFQRLHRQDEFPGLGIGLATVRRIVERHGGEIQAQAQPGAGATFTFTLAPEG